MEERERAKKIEPATLSSLISHEARCTKSPASSPSTSYSASVFSHAQIRCARALSFSPIGCARILLPRLLQPARESSFSPVPTARENPSTIWLLAPSSLPIYFWSLRNQGPFLIPPFLFRLSSQLLSFGVRDSRSEIHSQLLVMSRRTKREMAPPPYQTGSAPSSQIGSAPAAIQVPAPPALLGGGPTSTGGQAGNRFCSWFLYLPRYVGWLCKIPKALLKKKSFSCTQFFGFSVPKFPWPSPMFYRCAEMSYNILGLCCPLLYFFFLDFLIKCCSKLMAE